MELLNKLDDHISARLKQILYPVLITAVILLGVGLFSFPPAGLCAVAGLFAVKIIGASLALSGSVFGGLGLAIYKQIKTHFKAPQQRVIHDEEKTRGQIKVPDTQKTLHPIQNTNDIQKRLQNQGCPRSVPIPHQRKKIEIKPTPIPNHDLLHPAILGMLHSSSVPNSPVLNIYPKLKKPTDISTTHHYDFLSPHHIAPYPKNATLEKELKAPLIIANEW